MLNEDINTCVDINCLVHLNNTEFYTSSKRDLQVVINQFMKDEGCTYTRDVVVRADTLLKQTIPDFPCKNRRALTFVEGNLAYDFRRGYSRLTTTDGSGPDRSGFIVPAIIIICGTIR